MPKPPRQSLNDADAAAYLDVSRDYLRKKRQTGGGPVYAKFGRMIRYRIADLDKFIEAHLVGKKSDRAS